MKGIIKLGSSGRHTAGRTPATRSARRRRVHFALAVIQAAGPSMALWTFIVITQAVQLVYI